MKKNVIFASVLLLLLLATSSAFASPSGFTEFTTTGWTTHFSGPEFLPGGQAMYQVEAAGTVSSDCSQGEVCFDKADFTFTEWIIANPVGSHARNGGILTITSGSSEAVFEFRGTADASRVHGTFRALNGSGSYEGLSKGGTYEGIPDPFDGTPFWVTYTGRLTTDRD